MIEYFIENWDGWPLHALIAFVLMLPFITNSYPRVMFLLHLIFWPMREAWQHDGIHDIWTPHRIMEWGAPVVVAGMMLLYYEVKYGKENTSR